MTARRLARGPILVSGELRILTGSGPLGIAGSDLERLRPILSVTTGARVLAGDLLFTDRRRPWIRAVAPQAGVVTRLEPGPRRGLSLIEITPDQGARSAGYRDFDLSQANSRNGLAELMQQAGIWTALRRRPFGRAPDPAELPEALFVTITAGRDGAPDPVAAMRGLETRFLRGLAALRLLTPGSVWLCHPPGIPAPDLTGIRPVMVRAGLPSAHIHQLHPVAHGGAVWQIGWQEVTALGHLLETGSIWSQRILALSGPAVAQPGLILAPIGARLHDVAAGRLRPEPLRLLVGGAAGTARPYLRPGLDQITAVPHRATLPRGRLGRLAAALRPALVPNLWDDLHAPAGVLPTPLLRALASGDAGLARDLGVLGLVEEDLAELSLRLGGGCDYPALLRQTLDELEAMA